MRRNSAIPQAGACRPYAAQARADGPSPRPKFRKILRNPWRREAVQTTPDEKWSPEQICHALRQKSPGQPETHIGT